MDYDILQNLLISGTIIYTRALEIDMFNPLKNPAM